jgi:hypothetical protein
MTRLSSLTIVLSVGGFLLSSCVTNKCSLPEFENEADCQPQDTPPGMDSVFDVSSQRWSLEKDVTTTLSFTPATLTSEQSPAIESVSLLQGGVTFPVASHVVDGKLSVRLGTLSAGTSNLKPGPVTLVINGTQELAARLYVPPKFDRKMISKDITTDLTTVKLPIVRAVGLLNYSDTSGVAKANLGLLAQDAASIPALGLYGFEITTGAVGKFGGYSTDRKGYDVAARDGLAVSVREGFQFGAKADSTTNVYSVPPPEFRDTPLLKSGFGRIVSLSTDEKASLYAGIVGSKVVVSKSADLASPLTIKGVAPQTPVLVLVGELNGDGHADVVSWDSSGSAFVTMSSGNGFQDTVASADFKLQRPIGPVALGDMDLDGIADLVTVPSGTSPVLMVKFGDGKGGVAESTSLSFSATTTTPAVTWKQIDQIAVSVGGAESPLVRGVAVAGKTDKDITVIGVLTVTHPQ